MHLNDSNILPRAITGQNSSSVCWIYVRIIFQTLSLGTWLMKLLRDWGATFGGHFFIRRNGLRTFPTSTVYRNLLKNWLRCATDKETSFNVLNMTQINRDSNDYIMKLSYSFQIPYFSRTLTPYWRTPKSWRRYIRAALPASSSRRTKIQTRLRRHSDPIPRRRNHHHPRWYLSTPKIPQTPSTEFRRNPQLCSEIPARPHNPRNYQLIQRRIPFPSLPNSMEDGKNYPDPQTWREQTSPIDPSPS